MDYETPAEDIPFNANVPAMASGVLRGYYGDWSALYEKLTVVQLANRLYELDLRSHLMVQWSLGGCSYVVLSSNLDTIGTAGQIMPPKSKRYLAANLSARQLFRGLYSHQLELIYLVSRPDCHLSTTRHFADVDAIKLRSVMEVIFNA
jgi:hypothetical protein